MGTKGLGSVERQGMEDMENQPPGYGLIDTLLGSFRKSSLPGVESKARKSSRPIEILPLF